MRYGLWGVFIAAARKKGRIEKRKAYPGLGCLSLVNGLSQELNNTNTLNLFSWKKKISTCGFNPPRPTGPCSVKNGGLDGSTQWVGLILPPLLWTIFCSIFKVKDFGMSLFSPSRDYFIRRWNCEVLIWRFIKKKKKRVNSQSSPVKFCN